MNNEFKKTASKNQTVYTLESAGAGGTSAGSIASISGPIGRVQKRGQLVTSSTEKKIPASTPRNFVAKNAKTGGAGAHKDKKKSEKQGNVKHKKPFAEGAVKELSADLKSMSAEEFLAKYKKTKAEARAAMKSVAEGLQVRLSELKSIVEGFGRNRGYSHGFASPNAPQLGSRPNHGDDERHELDDPELQRNRQEVTSYNITINGKPINPKPIFGRSATIKWGKDQTAAGVDLSNAMLSPVRDNQQGVAEGDAYMESLQAMVERQLEPTMDLDAWNDNFQNADPQKYHQFKNKSPEKKK